jgi:hypothetical protein
MEMQAKQVCTITALALICACDLEGDDFEAVGSSVHEVRGPKDVLEKIADAEPGSRVEFPGSRPQQIEAAMRQMNARLRPKKNKPEELEADETFEKTLNTKQKRGLDKIKKGYADRVRAGDIKPVKGVRGDWELEVKGPSSGSITGPPGATRSLEHAFDDDGLGLATPPHYFSPCDWSISNGWWGTRIKLSHSCLHLFCVAPEWLFDRIQSWLGKLLRSLQPELCRLHSADTANRGATCYVTWVGIGWCVVG